MSRIALSLLTLATACAVPAAWAADTPMPGISARPAAATPSTADRLASARRAIEAKDWAVAMRELEAAEKADPRNADVQNLLGYSYRKRATPDLVKAFHHYGNALKIDPRHKGAHEYIGEAYLQDRKPAEAEKHLVELEKICGGKMCEEYQDLAKSIAEYKAKNPS